MRAVDTNVLVRLIVADDAAQVVTAERILAERFIVLPTVVMETIWVLEKVYRLEVAVIGDRLRRLFRTPAAHVVSARSIKWALGQYEQGADFADVLHVALAKEAEATSFATFDKGMTNEITEPPIPIETLT